MLQHPAASLRAAAERADSRANRARLMAAAREVFREHGPDAEMKEIAERAGLGVGTIYRNFPTKDDLIVALITETVGEIQTVLADAARLDDSVAAVRYLLRHGFDVSERHGDLMMMMMGGQLPPECKDLFVPVAALLQGIIQTGIDRGQFRSDVDPAIVSAQIRTAFIPWSYQELRATRTPDEIADAYMGVILRGIVADPSPRERAGRGASPSA